MGEERRSSEAIGDEIFFFIDIGLEFRLGLEWE